MALRNRGAIPTCVSKINLLDGMKNYLKHGHLEH